MQCVSANWISGSGSKYILPVALFLISMPVHSLIFINPAGNVIYSKYFLATATSDYKLFFEQHLFKQTSPNWNRISSIPSTISIADVHVVFQTIGDMIVFASGVDDVDETILIEVLATIEKVLFDVLDQKSITETQFLIPDNYGKFVISVDDMMSQGIIETFDAGLIGKLSKLKPL